MRTSLLKTIVTAAAFLVGVASASVAHATQVLVNPGFETGALAPWFVGRDFGASQDWTVTSAVTHSGSFAATDNGNEELRQNFAPVATSAITDVSFWAEHPGGASESLLAYDFFYSDNTSDEFTVNTTGTGFNSFDVTAQLAAGKSLVGFSIFGNSNGITYFDDASIVANTSSVPEPASMVLLGTGLLCAGARRWRNRRPRG